MRRNLLGPPRTAGLLYLIVVVTGIISLGWIPSQLIVPGDAARTIANISASEGLYRIGIAAGFVCYTTFLLLPLALYRVLGHVSRSAAVMMVAFALVSVPISLGNLVNRVNVLTLVSGSAHTRGLTPEQLHSAVMLSMAEYSNGILIAEIFWGLWLLPLGYLVFRSRMLPRLLGILLMAGCFGYLFDVFGTTLFVEYPEWSVARFATRPASLGEIGTCLWLVVMGAKERPRDVGESTFAESVSADPGSSRDA